MATVNVEWALSKKAAFEQFAQTGQRPNIVQFKNIDLEPLAVEQRRVLLAQAYNPATEQFRNVDAHGQKSGTVTHPPDLSTKDYLVEFEAEPSVEQIVEAVTRLATMETERKAEVELARERERVRFAQQKEDEARIKSDLRTIEDSLDLKAAKAYVMPEGSPAYIAAYKDGAINAILGKMEDAQKSAWITAHGSDHLKRACAAGYDCQRLYVVERAALEAPGWIVDYNGTGHENSRSCPSLEALEIEEVATTLASAIGALAPSVMWLTEQPTNQPKGAHSDEDWDEESFEPCEVVRMRNYLGKYDLYKIV